MRHHAGDGAAAAGRREPLGAGGIVGSGCVPPWEGSILFLEDVDEGIHRMDRMLTQLALPGVLGMIRGIVFGKCTDSGTGNSPGGGYASRTLDKVLAG